MKALFQRHLISLDKETVIESNGCHIESYPSHHVDSFRALESPKFILIDEGDFFPIGHADKISDMFQKDMSQRAILYIVMVSTPNAPTQLFESIEKEPEETCIYRKLFLDFKYGLGRIYSEQEIEKAKASPSFEREYNLKYLGVIGNVFSTKDIESSNTERY